MFHGLSQTRSDSPRPGQMWIVVRMRRLVDCVRVRQWEIAGRCLTGHSSCTFCGDDRVLEGTSQIASLDRRPVQTASSVDCSQSSPPRACARVVGCLLLRRHGFSCVCALTTDASRSDRSQAMGRSECLSCGRSCVFCDPRSSRIVGHSLNGKIKYLPKLLNILPASKHLKGLSPV